MVKRNTFQNALVLDTVRKLKSHPTADEIYAAITKDYPTVSRATVYRNLQQLCEMGEIRKREIPGSPDRYDHAVSDHYHAKCTRCGKFIDVEMSYIADLEKRISYASGFQITGHNIVFEGLCPECQKKAEN